MSAAASPKKPWDTSRYLRIAAADYDAGDLVVRFVDGTEARIAVDRMTTSRNVGRTGRR